MIFENGFPRPAGASDFEDSSMLGGCMAVIGHHKAPKLDQYIDSAGFYRRCPDSKYNFSRDQFVCLIAGMKAQGIDPGVIDTNRITGRDLLSPAIMGHVQRCKGRIASWYQDAWLWADLAFSAYVKPLEELNQLFCIMLVADQKFIKWYCKANPKWELALKNYWCENSGAWRQEPELCFLFIEKVKEACLSPLPFQRS